MTSPRSRRATARRLLLALAVAGALLALCAPGAGARPNAGASAVAVDVQINTQDPRPVVPRGFLGLSFEASALGQISRFADRGDLVGLLRSLGPGVLRFGGITSDENAAWTDARTPLPAWASVAINDADIRAIGELARRSGWRVLLTVGLAHYDPEAAAREVAAASRALGPRLEAVEIGNEADSYAQHGLRELPWVAEAYEEQVSAYREAIDALTPNVPIAGPDVSGSGIFKEWGEAEVLAQRPGLALLTGHHYPLGCAQKPAPTISELLSPGIHGLEVHSLGTYMQIAQASGIPLRIDEAGSVSCGGVAGISDTFAASLWATGYITQAMSAGATGINLEGNPTHCVGYTPVCAIDARALASGTLRAEPAWYALLLTRSLVGDRPLPAGISSAASPNLIAEPFEGPGRSVQVVLVDDEPRGSSPLEVKVAVGSGLASAHVLRLTAPSLSATSGVRLGGRQVARDGSWSPPPEGGSSVPIRSGVVALKLAPASAALLSASPAHRPRGH
jgi:hypothetical protein